ncbi:maltose alpha-D-glucosyltransferase [Synechococcus sp. Nb3U1]|uniref:maltose alpha-D-glucosyltransferase n=1 Tax=Synechococcus sp. Nb3U1 TaxID=1914529 RepID=UPI001F361B42|nr:maltose alpha-D-glucosyltransferase [Synechococcus sp. Nb3U1]
MTRTSLRSTSTTLIQNPLWYKDAVIYEVPVRAFADSDGDGVGDFQGLTEKLDYLQDLGVTAIWLLPFFPSPLRDDGYDVADFTSVNPTFGTLEDFKALLEAAHQRGIRVIIELILNHTSDQHPWFQRARRAAPGTPERDFYVWSDTPEKYKEARIIFQDFETSNWSWDPVAKAYYWHRFYSHQPDLNYDNPAVQKAVFEVVDFWLDMGVDGLRLDAVPYLYEREGTNCENLPETHALLKALRKHIDRKYQDRMLLAEANQWPEDAVAYFGDGDECHMDFHFPLMPRLFMAIQMEDRFPIIDILQQTPPIPDNCQWAIFLRNHDELTLEMVTDEERDYMYQVYAKDPSARVNLGIRRRLSPLLGNSRRRIELMNSLLFSLPGTPVLYYGDEIGMGDNIYLGDRNGVRTPMQWSADRNAGFSRANPQKLYLPIVIDAEYHYETVNVEAQRNNPYSLWWAMKRLIAVRKRFQAFGQGSFELLHPENRKVLCFMRVFEEERILVMANLSRYVQCVELELAEWEGLIPVEIFGRTEFPPIGQLPYFLTLGPHSFYWFSLEPQRQPERLHLSHSKPEDLERIPTLTTKNGSWESLFQGEAQKLVEAVLADYLYRCRWFGSKARQIQSAQIVDAIPCNREADPSFRGQILILQTEFTEGDAETYLLPVGYATQEAALQMRLEMPQAVIAPVQVQGDPPGILFDALADKNFLHIPLQIIAQQGRLRQNSGELLAATLSPFEYDPSQEPRILKAEQSNTSVVYGNQYILKFYRKIAEGVNPELEIGRYLVQHHAQVQVPKVLGSLEYRRRQGSRGLEPAHKSITLAILQEYIPNEGDAWHYTLDSLGQYFETVLIHHQEVDPVPVPQGSLLQLSQSALPELAYATIGSYLESVRILAKRTAELHIALAADIEDKDFAPEPFSSLYQRSVYQSMRNLAGQVFPLLTKQIRKLPETEAKLARVVKEQEDEIMSRFRLVLEQKITALRTRCHGDYHLGQVLFTGKDFVIIDFEGEPSRSLGERRLKRFPLRDVAGMLRSFHYAVSMALRQQLESGLINEDNRAAMMRWAQFWHRWVCAGFLAEYLQVASQKDSVPPVRSAFLPRNLRELEVLLDAYLLEKAIYELGYELNNRPDWVEIPLRGILQLLGISTKV